MTGKKIIAGWSACIIAPIIVIGGINLVSRNFARPNISFPVQMAETASFMPFERNPVFPDGTTMQVPPEGTIARGSHTFHFDTSEADRIKAGIELENPFSAEDPPVQKRGKKVYENFCLVCHGKSGAGDGPVIPKYPNPPSFRTLQSREMHDGEMFHIITAGRRNMPSYASQVGYQDRWKVISYIRSLQE